MKCTQKQIYPSTPRLEQSKTLMRLDKAQAAVLAVEALLDNISRARGSNAPCANKMSLNSSPSPATFPKAHAHCSATGTELFSVPMNVKLINNR